jgi:predicted lipoprotein
LPSRDCSPLEYVLYGDGSEILSAGEPDTFRCRYGRAIVGAIATTAREIADGWTADGGYAGVMRDAGPENPVYRSHGEALQAVISAAREMLLVVRDLKLGRSIGETPPAAVPRRAPFWRSELALAAIRTNIAAVLALLNSGGLGSILPEESSWLAGSLAFELGRADGALSSVHDSGEDWEVAVHDPKNHQPLAYSLIPLGGAIEILENGFPDALGLLTGFNSLDGD